MEINDNKEPAIVVQDDKKPVSNGYNIGDGASVGPGFTN